MLEKIVGTFIIFAIMGMGLFSVINPEKAFKNSFGNLFRNEKPSLYQVTNTKISGIVFIVFGVYFLYIIWTRY